MIDRVEFNPLVLIKSEVYKDSSEVNVESISPPVKRIWCGLAAEESLCRKRKSDESINKSQCQTSVGQGKGDLERNTVHQPTPCA